MSLLTRYILSELLKVLLLTLTGLTVLIMVVLVGWEAIRQGLGLGPVLRLVPYALPQSLCFSVPGTVLFAACMVYGRMSAANEIVVLKSLGLSPHKAIMPGVWLALGLSCLGVFLNDVAFSWGYHGLHRVVIQSAEEIAYGVLRTQRTYSTDRFSISVKDVEGKQLLRPTITFAGGAGSLPVTITAQEARLASNLEKSTLSIFLTDGIVEVGDKISMVFPGTIERVIPLADASRKGVSSSPSHMSLRQIPQAARDQRKKISNLEEAQAAQAAFALAAGDFSALSESHWQGHRSEIEWAEAHLNRLHTEPWRRSASGFSCLCFMCVGAPLAILRRHGDFMTNFFWCFFPILIGYYPLFLASLDFAKGGDAPAYTVWSGNVACLLVGAWLMRKVVRH